MRKLNFEKFGITDRQLRKIKLVLAFDLGHGESMVSYMRTDGRGKPLIAKVDSNDSDKLITGLFKVNRDNAGWAISRIGPMLSSFNEVHIGFKSTPEALNQGETEPGSARTKKELIQAYVKEVLKAVKLYNEGLESDEDSTVLFVGCPSSRLWKNQEKAYADILKKESPYPVVIMPESRAALFKVIFDHRLLNASNILQNGIIVFDFGSSTADWTYMYKNLSKGKMDLDEDSVNLGGSMVEEQMLEAGIERLIRQAKKEREHKIRGIVEAMRRIPALAGLSEEELWSQAASSHGGEEDDWKPRDEQETLLALRTVKENYFFADGELEQEYAYRMADNRVHRFKINREFMEAKENGVIHQKFTYATRDGIWEKSWYDACRQLFMDVKSRMEEKTRQYSSIVLTGGASRMGFVRELCREVFGDKVEIVADPNPSTCVARGMAYAGVMDIKARLALPEVMEKVTDKIEKGENGRTLLMDCAEIASNDLKETLYDKVIWPGIQSWKGLEGVHTPRELCGTCRDTLKALQQQDSYQETVRRSIQDGILKKRDEIIGMINETYKEIYQREIPANYRINLDDDKLKNIAGGVVEYTFGDAFEQIIKGALSFWGSATGYLNTLDNQMDKAERTKRADRIVRENRKPKLEGFCGSYLRSLIGRLFEQDGTKENLKNCIREAVETMLDDLSAYFA